MLILQVTCFLLLANSNNICYLHKLLYVKHQIAAYTMLPVETCDPLRAWWDPVPLC